MHRYTMYESVQKSIYVEEINNGIVFQSLSIENMIIVFKSWIIELNREKLTNIERRVAIALQWKWVYK